MRFGERLIEQKYSPWADHYIDYKQLKELLNNQEDHDHRHGTSTISSTTSRNLTTNLPPYISSANLAILYEETANTSFLITLNQQVERVVLFYLYQQGLIASQMQECRTRLSEIHSSNLSSRVTSLQQECKNMAFSLLQLIQFVDLNVTGLRKILKKHDKINKKSLSDVYFGHPRKILQPLLQTESIDSLMELLEKCYRDVYVLTLDSMPHVTWGNEEANQYYDPDPDTYKDGNRAGGADYHDRSSRRLVSSPSMDFAAGTNTNTNTNTVRHLYHERFTNRRNYTQEDNFDDSIEHLLYQIHKARRELQQSSDFVNYLAASMMVPEVGETEDEQSLEDEGVSYRAISNFLNLMSTFLFMTNYYIVAPTSSSYAAHLGILPSLGSLIIGMTPIATLVSTVLYSWWTNYSYKSALVFASTCSAIGNLFYALGLPYNSITLVLIGRLLLGFGSARSINRTYIADSYARNERTAASAWFVTAGALGMAAGPALSSFLLYADHMGLRSFYFQDLNSSGWLMFIVWMIYLVCLMAYFYDPPRKHEPTPPEELSMKTMGEGGEKQPLLKSSSGDSSHTSKLSLSAYVPVVMTFLIYFVLKLILECLMSSTSTITNFYFGWSENTIGFFMMALGLLMVPANLAVAQLSQHYSDRQLIVGMQVWMGLGCIIIMKLGVNYPLSQYILGSLTLFLSANACEGPNMSLLSKTIPRSWSKGVVNVGLLATEAGTFGRVVGDLYLTFCGARGMEFLLNRVYGTMAFISVGSVLLTYLAYDLLDPMDKDD